MFVKQSWFGLSFQYNFGSVRRFPDSVPPIVDEFKTAMHIETRRRQAPDFGSRRFRRDPGATVFRFRIVVIFGRVLWFCVAWHPVTCRRTVSFKFRNVARQAPPVQWRDDRKKNEINKMPTPIPHDGQRHPDDVKPAFNPRGAIRPGKISSAPAIKNTGRPDGAGAEE